MEILADNFFDETSQARTLSQAWQQLCERHLPVTHADSIWRFSHDSQPGDLEQGWKLHISATVLNAVSLMEKVAPVLAGCGVKFKAPVSLQEVGRLNSGLYHGYSQIGKVITVYPRTSDEAVLLARQLHNLTSSFLAPAVPFDLRFQPESNVYYRYGAFKRLELRNAAGQAVPAIRDPRGNLVPDLRDTFAATPNWVENPFPHHDSAPVFTSRESPLSTTFRAFRALTQRGKGGVYQAFDLSLQPPRFCLLKEGRRFGEVGWDGRDGYWRIKHEEQVLTQLRTEGIAVPRVRASFDLDGNRYLVTEFIEGESLQALLFRQQRRLPIRRALQYGSEIATIVAGIHASGWIWRDCKPSNFILAAGSGLRPVDFEGACPIDQPDSEFWGTPGYVPATELAGNAARSTLNDDLYSLGAVIYLLLAGKLPESSRPTPLGQLRRNVPSPVCAIVMTLLTAPPKQRPGAQTVANALKMALPSGGQPKVVPA